MPPAEDRLDFSATPIDLVKASDWSTFAEVAPRRIVTAAAAAGFCAKPGRWLGLWDADGKLERAICGLSDEGAMAARWLPTQLPPGDYRIASTPPELEAKQLALAWSLGAYRFDRYKQAGAEPRARLVEPGASESIIADACALARDLINTPANDMGPDDLESAAVDLAKAPGAGIAVTRGADLLSGNYPAVHAVGRAAVAARAPRMIEITWGESHHPLVAIIGKGVVFDTGGLDLKPSAGMRWMKKDMGGAAHALALTQMIMRTALPIRLCVLTPVVENVVSGDAMRPGDVLPSRKGLSIEIGNTDAEGRLVLADALTRAAELDPDLTIDLATLTGAARVAVGPEIVPFYTDNDDLAAALAAAARAVEDPLWRMPLWAGYEAALESDVADIKNDADAWSQAGSITAALFLKRFAPKGVWAHFDIFAWNARGRPGWPQGAEAQAIRAIFAMLQARYR